MNAMRDRPRAFLVVFSGIVMVRLFLCFSVMLELVGGGLSRCRSEMAFTTVIARM